MATRKKKQPPPQNCGTCALTKPSYLPGWLHCQYMPTYQSVSPSFGCHFNPIRWVKREADRA